MDYPPLALLPCRLMLALAGLLIAPVDRPEWEQEWFAELWHRYLEGFRGARGDANDGTPKRALSVYRLCFGCFRDAWCLFEEQDLLLLDTSTCRGNVAEITRTLGFP